MQQNATAHRKCDNTTVTVHTTCPVRLQRVWSTQAIMGGVVADGVLNDNDSNHVRVWCKYTRADRQTILPVHDKRVQCARHCSPAAAAGTAALIRRSCDPVNINHGDICANFHSCRRSKSYH
ncbi:hypothetical protein MTP99_013628 [Tenebrio molitor]|nr:hypothetical protein MTP99_013628 [Tenebrio molitor]